MTTKPWLPLGALACAFGLASSSEAAPDQRDHRAPAHVVSPRPAAPPKGRDVSPRTVGAHVVPHPEQPVHPTNNPPHQIIYHDPKTGREEHHAVVVDHRPAHIIDRDVHLRVVGRGYHPAHDWERFHRVSAGWWHIWGIANWESVGTVTCEAANEANGELYPVSEDRDRAGWDDATVNTILDQALDDCATESGDPAACIPATPSCTFQP